METRKLGNSNLKVSALAGSLCSYTAFSGGGPGFRADSFEPAGLPRSGPFLEALDTM